MAARFWVGGTGTWDGSDTTHWAATSNGVGGQSVPGSGDTVTFDGSSGGGTVTVNTNFNVTSVTMGAFTGTLTFATNNNSPTMQTFNCSGTGARTLNMGSGTWTLTGNNGTIWNVSTITNLTVVRSNNPIISNYSGSTGVRTIAHANTGEGSVPHWSITAGSDTVNISNTRVGNLDFTGFTGILGTGTFTVYGNLTFSANMTLSATTNSITMTATSGSKTIDTKSVTIDRPLTIGENLASTTIWTLVSNLVLGTTRSLGIAVGTFSAGGFDVTTGFFSSSNTNTRTINMGSGTWTLTGASGTPWTFATASGLTFNPDTSTLVISDTGASSKTIQTGSKTFNNVTIAGGGAGAVIFGGAPTFNVFTINAPKSVTFSATQTFTFSTFTAIGSFGNVITLTSTAGGSQAVLSKSSGAVISDYLSIQDISATGGASWYAGANSTNVSNNRGWQFSNQDVSKANFFQMM